MPRRYRPPTRRRKTKKAGHYDEAAAAGPREAGVAPLAAPPPRPEARPAAPLRGEHQIIHIGRDHSYILAELRLIALIVAFIIGGLIITAILR